MGFLRYVTFIFLVFSLSAYAQLSPGDLSEVHKDLEGLSNCTSCHELGEGPSVQKCLDCHKVLKQQIDNSKGLHYSYTKVEKKLCFSCHNEHAGRDFQLIKWEPPQKEFDHTKTGYSLEGKHTTIQCRDCHNPSLIHTNLQAIEEKIDITKTFFGLGTNCLSCHNDEHRKQLGENCTSCHTQNNWKESVQFDHNKAKFQLTGKHQQVDCQKCHATIIDEHPVYPKDTTYVKFINLSFQNCTSCHKDKHNNKFGQDCTRCHVTAGWKILDERNIDHNKTNFPLLGKHVGVKCDNCHKSGKKFKADQYNECKDCHSDYHQNQFAKRTDKGACESCHQVTGFKPALFPIASHNETEFKLTGAHLAQPCFVCHKMTESAKPIMNFKPTERLCQDCHRDPHMSQFSSTKTCLNCHNETDWKESTFNHNTGSSYVLQGAHKNVSCDGCHKEVTNGTEKYILYKPLDTKCESCHTSKVEPLG